MLRKRGWTHQIPVGCWCVNVRGLSLNLSTASLTEPVLHTHARLTAAAGVGAAPLGCAARSTSTRERESPCGLSVLLSVGAIISHDQNERNC